MHVKWDNAVWKCPASEQTAYKCEILLLAEEHLRAWMRRVLFYERAKYGLTSEEPGWGDSHPKVTLLALHVFKCFLPDLLRVYR